MKLKILLLATFFTQLNNAQDYELVKPQEIHSIVDFLSSDILKGRETATEGELVAAQFIKSKFIEAGIKPYFDTYFDAFKSKGFKGVNVVGYIEGNDPALKEEILLLGAHYDHIGIGNKVKMIPLLMAPMTMLLALPPYWPLPTDLRAQAKINAP